MNNNKSVNMFMPKEKKATFWSEFSKGFKGSFNNQINEYKQSERYAEIQRGNEEIKIAAKELNDIFREFKKQKKGAD